MSLNGSTDGQATDQFATIPDVSVDAIANRVNPNQVASGNIRGSAQIIPGADGNPQVLIGNQVHFGNGLYVAKTGKNVTTVTDGADLSFNSTQNVFKIVSTGTASIAAASPQTTQSTTITHSLGYIPMCLAFITYSSGFTVQLPYIDPGPPSSAGTIRTLIDIYTTTTTTIQFEVVNYSATLTTGLVTIKYYLLQETAV